MDSEERKLQMVRDKRIKRVDYVFCLPGNPSSNTQEMALFSVLLDLLTRGKTFATVPAINNNIYMTRNLCLSRPINIGTPEEPILEQNFRVDQKPFEGQIDDYEKIIWVDSDNIPSPRVLLRLLSHDVDMVGAWYRQYSAGPLNDKNLTACGFWQTNEGEEAPHIRPILVGEMATWPKGENGLIEVDYAGMGLFVNKKGVIESLEYPWFYGPTIEWKVNGVKMAQLITDDVGFEMRAKQKGFHIFVDPECGILHERKVAV